MTAEEPPYTAFGLTHLKCYGIILPRKKIRLFQKKESFVTKTARACFVGILLVCFALPGRAYSQEKTKQFFEITTAKCAIVRTQPTTASARIDCVAKGMVLPVADIAGNWVKVVVPASDKTEKTGYISRSLGKVLELVEGKTGEFATVPTAKPISPLPSNSGPSTEVVVPRPAAKQDTVPTNSTTVPAKQPGRLGVGLDFATAPGAIPSVMYDLTDRVTVKGGVGMYAGVTTLLGEALYTFPRPVDDQSDYTFKPYVGVGLIEASVSYGFGSESFSGLIASGGTFITVKKIPNWRFSGDISLIRFSVDGLSVSGLGVRMGAHYFFSKP